MPASLFQPRIYAALPRQPFSFHRHGSAENSRKGRKVEGRIMKEEEGEFAAYFSASILPFTLTLNVAPHSERMAHSMISGKHLVNLFACSQNVRSVHPGLRKNTVCPASFQALTSCGLRLIATSAVTMTESSSLANAFIQTASSTLGRNSSRKWTTRCSGRTI